METTYYTLTSREVIISGDGVAQAAGGAPERQVVLLRTAANTASAPARAGNVIDLAAWKSAREEEARLEEEWYGGEDEAPAQPAPAQPRSRRSHRSAVLLGGELLATLSVVGTMAVLMARMLLV